MIEPITSQEPQQQDDEIDTRSIAVQILSDVPLRSSINAYSCIAFERADYSLNDFLNKNKRKLDNIARQGIMHQILKGITWLHSRGRHYHHF
jgi:serine/threonine protein kinase